MIIFIKTIFVVVTSILATSCGILNNQKFWDSLSISTTTSSSNAYSSRRHIRSSLFEGAKIIASDGQFLGIATSNKYDANSILNEYGKYGGKYSSTSIFNEYGEYGGKYSSKSPFNDYATNPPKIITRDGRWAYLTTDKYKTPSVSPEEVIADISN